MQTSKNQELELRRQLADLRLQKSRGAKVDNIIRQVEYDLQLLLNSSLSGANVSHSGSPNVSNSLNVSGNVGPGAVVGSGQVNAHNIAGGNITNISNNTTNQRTTTISPQFGNSSQPITRDALDWAGTIVSTIFLALFSYAPRLMSILFSIFLPVILTISSLGNGELSQLAISSPFLLLTAFGIYALWKTNFLKEPDHHWSSTTKLCVRISSFFGYIGVGLFVIAFIFSMLILRAVLDSLKQTFRI